MSYLILIALMMLVVSPVLIPLIITGGHATGSLWQMRRQFLPPVISTRSVAREQ
jgi:hypothetical protein